LKEIFHKHLNGNIDEIDKIVFSEQMGNNRAGDILLVDYER